MTPRPTHQRTPHILSTASNLLGFCLIVQTSMRLGGGLERTFVDELTALTSLVLMVTCILSFLSLCSHNTRRSELYERVADLLFIAALFTIFVVIAVIAADKGLLSH